ncbi:hypothetical protein BDB00DRAFT_867748 [Zychaea mexicana]|uniref:uncharacterized protein n=1 Tax=Zychaea mexicana TaxID=64656 RepID=UPI0022FE53D7|nr:uncharacterized protein BDB00DRAFT_867748 [Zychaea mexicana]KAI9498094.1 hypothetical protein BDB00DRAFT_867748 [Zychaea mexicana]
MSPRPEYEPDENEPDENEPDEDEGGHHSINKGSPSPTPTGNKNHHHDTATSSPTDTSGNTLPSSSNNNNTVPTSTIGPLTVALVVILVVITCCILHCARIRKRLNDQQRTQTINGWTSFLSQFKKQANNEDQTIIARDVEEGTVAAPGAAVSSAGTIEKEGNSSSTRRKPVKKRDYYDRAFQYRMSKPPPLPPYETDNEANQRGNSNSSNNDERQPSIVFSPGWLFAFSDKQNERESKISQKHLIKEGEKTEDGAASTPLSPPEPVHHHATTAANSDRLCPHQVTVDKDPTPASPEPSLQKPHQKFSSEA